MEDEGKYRKSIGAAEKCSLGKKRCGVIPFHRHFTNPFYFTSPYPFTHPAMAAIPKHRQLPDKENKLFRELLVRAATTLHTHCMLRYLP